MTRLDLRTVCDTWLQMPRLGVWVDPDHGYVRRRRLLAFGSRWHNPRASERAPPPGMSRTIDVSDAAESLRVLLWRTGVAR